MIFILILSICIHSEPNLLVRACNQLGQFLSNRETNLRYLALESMCLLATSEFSHEAVKKHQEVVILSMKVFQQSCIMKIMVFVVSKRAKEPLVLKKEEEKIFKVMKVSDSLEGA